MFSIHRSSPFWFRSLKGSGLLVCVLMTACGGGGGGSTPAPPPVPSVTLSFGTGPVQLRQGQTASLPIAIQRGGGFTGAVRITADGLPAEVALSIAPAGDLTGNAATATFTASATAAVGTVNALMRVVAVAGSPSSGTTLSLQVQPPPQGFQVALGSAALSLPLLRPGDTQPWASAPIPITLTRVGGYAGSPVWTVEGLPSGVTAAFSPSAVGEPASFMLSVGPGASAGTSTLTVRATDGTLTATALVGLTLSAGTGNDFQLKPNVLELDNSVTVLDVQAGTVTLQGAVPSVVAGKVLVHNAADGLRFLRKVDSVSSQGGNTVLTTSDATVEDVFATASINKTEAIPVTALAGMRPANSAITIGAPIPGLMSPQGDQQLVLPVGFGNLQIKDGSGTVLVVVNGSITLTLGVETRLEKDGLQVREFRVAPYVAVTGDLDIKGNYTADFHDEYPISLPFYFPTPIGIGPLGVNGDLTLTLAVDGHFDAQGNLHVHGSVNGKAGVQYVNGNWSGVSDFSTSLAMTSAEVRASAQLGVSLLRPNLGLDVLGIGEVHVTSDVIRGEVDIAYQTSPTPGFLISRYGDFKFGVGGSVKLGPITLWNDQFLIDLGRFLSGTPTLVPDLTPADTRIAYVTPDLHELHVMSGDGSGNSFVWLDGNAVFAPSLDPTGRMIAFGRINNDGNGDLCTINVDGTGFTNHTHNVYPTAYSINHPAWGPNGVIAFDAADAAHVKQLYTLNLANGTITQLTYDATNSRHPAWSPDGTYLLYEFQTNFGSTLVARTNPSVPHSYDVIYANDTLNFQDPSYSPNGRQIIFRDDSYFYIASESGTLAHQIPMGTTLLKHPVFSPDGSQIAADANPVGPPSILVMGADGSSARSIATGSYPAWRKIQ